MPILNLAEFNKTMSEKIPAAIIAQLKQTIEEAAQPMVSQMKSLAPVDTRTSSGRRRHSEHLRDSIRMTWGTDKRAEKAALTMRLIIMAGSKGTLVSAGKRAKQFQLARLIEFGTQEHPARPFFFPIWRAYRRKLRAKMSQQVNIIIAGYSTSASDIEAAA